MAIMMWVHDMVFYIATHAKKFGSSIGIVFVVQQEFSGSSSYNLERQILILHKQLVRSGQPFPDEVKSLEYFEHLLQQEGVGLETPVCGSVNDGGGRGSLASFSDSDFEDVLQGAGAIDPGAAEQAGRALRTLRLRGVVCGALRALYDRAVAQAVYARKIRDEQNLISERWNVEAARIDREKKKSKNKRRKKIEEADGGADLHSSGGAEVDKMIVGRKIRGIVDSFARKVNTYRHYKKAINALNSQGMLEAFGCLNKRGPHRVLHGAECRSMTFVEPHGGSKEHSKWRFLRTFGAEAG